jgi:glutamyl/glutaminyl-tRNA synthetase
LTQLCGNARQINQALDTNYAKSRIAPTPSGYLHAGNLYSFVLTWLWMKAIGGKLLLRIDDIDAERVRAGYIRDIFDSLAFCELSYDEGPVNPADFAENWSQHKRRSAHENLLAILAATGQVYACTCSRKKIMLGTDAGIYPGTCREKKLSLSTPGAAWRIYIPPQSTIFFEDRAMGMQSIRLDEVMGDFVIRRKNGLPAYQVASLADDVQFGITHIVRGQDLLHSTAAQLYLAQVAGFQGFAQTQWWHHPLQSTTEGLKLSKSAGDTSLKYMRANGARVQDLLKTAFAGMLPGGIEHTLTSLQSLRAAFVADPKTFLLQKSA